MEKVLFIAAATATVVGVIWGFEAMSIPQLVLFSVSGGCGLYFALRCFQLDSQVGAVRAERNFHYWKAQDATLRLSLNGEMLQELQSQNMVTPEGHALLNERWKANTIAIREWGKEHTMPPIPRNEGPYVSEPTK
jgi:hypothetical protein